MATATLTFGTTHNTIDGFGISRADTDFATAGHIDDGTGVNWLAWESKEVSATTAVNATFTLSGTDDGLVGVVTYKRTGSTAVVQKSKTYYNGVFGGQNFGVMLDSPVTSGNFLWMVVIFFQNLAAVGTISATDSLGQTWNLDFSADLPATDGCMAVLSVPGTLAGSPLVNIHTSNALTDTNTTAQIVEFSGVSTSTPFDKSHSATFTTATALDSGATVTLSQANELVIGFAGLFNGHAFTVGAGYANLTQGPQGTAPGQVDFGLTSAIYDQLFTTTNGIGLSILRLGINSASTTNPISTCPADIQQFLKRVPSGKIYGVTWSPPATWKVSGTVTSFVALAVGNYTNFSTWLATWDSWLHTNYGVHAYAISVQNEPDFDPTGNAGACAYSDAQMHTFLQTHGANWVTQGLNGIVKIAMPEQSGWAFDRAVSTWADGTTAAYVGVVAAHNYAGSIANPAGPSGAAVWATEYAKTSAYDTTMTFALAAAVEWHSIITTTPDADNTAILWWQVRHSANSDNEGLIAVDGTLIKRYYALGNFSKYVRPGWIRIDVSYSGDGNSLLTAYKAVNGQWCIVAVRNAGTTESITFTLSGFPPTAAVTPYRTDASNNLAAQTSIAISAGAFTATLAASSVTTFALDDLMAQICF